MFQRQQRVQDSLAARAGKRINPSSKTLLGLADFSLVLSCAATSKKSDFFGLFIPLFPVSTNRSELDQESQWHKKQRQELKNLLRVNSMQTT